MNKSFISLICTAGVWAVFHYVLKDTFLQKEQTMLLNRYVFFLLMALSIIAVNLILRLKPAMALQWNTAFQSRVL